MVNGHRREQWSHTAALLTQLHNVNCAKLSDMIRDPEQLNPYADRRNRPRKSITLRQAGLALLGGKVELEADEPIIVEPKGE